MTEPGDLRPSLHEQVLVEAEIDGRLVGFRSVVVNVMPTAIWLAMVRPDSLMESVELGSQVGLTYRRGGAAMVTRTVFRGHLGARRSRLFAVEWSDDGQRVQRRAHLRLEAVCPIQYSVVSGEGAVEGRTGQGRTRNIGAGGLAFEVDRAPCDAVGVGDVIEIRLSLDGEVVLADADVVRVDDITDLDRDGRPLPPVAVGGGRPRRTLAAVQFVYISEAAQDLIVRHIFAAQRLRRDDRGGAGHDGRRSDRRVR